MSNVLLLSSTPEPPAEILPSLSLLPHTVRAAPPALAPGTGPPPPDVVLVDARRDLVQVRHLLQLVRASGFEAPVLVIVAEGGWAAVSADWDADDVILHTAGPGEVEARLRIAIGRAAPAASTEIKSGDLAIDEATYSARLRGRVLDLTFKEFELLKFLAQYPGRVFSRAQLLQEVWGYDYFGGTRTVDVHVRRLRAKLGADHESLIGTVRNVGYRFVPVKGESDRLRDQRRGPGEKGDSENRSEAASRDQGRPADPGSPSRSRDQDRPADPDSPSRSRDQDRPADPGSARTVRARAAIQREGRAAHADS